MICPIDQETLVLADRQGIEIDYCPTCRGVWLDRGELDKIIGHNRDGHGDEGSSPKTKKRKREGFLGELFEFGR